MIGEDKKITKEKIFQFLKKYSYLFVAGVLLIVLSIIIGVSVTKPKVNDNIINKPVVNPQTVTFYSPLLDATVIKDFSDKKLMYNETLNKWEAHLAIDLKTNGNGNVYASLDGKIINVYDNYLDGKVIVIEHSNNLKTIYKSLENSGTLKVGDYVSKGQVIGKVGLSNAEAYLGKHLHFEVMENNKKVDPNLYLNFTNK